jgi:hypothetical protein
MTRTTRISLLALWTASAWAMLVGGAQAYVDPGSTTVVFQAIIAFLAAAGTGLAMFRQRIVTFFRRSSSAAETPDAAAENEHA